MSATNRIIREPERKLITSLSPASAWRGEKAGTFPKRVRISENSVGWRLSEINAWVESRETITPENVKSICQGARRGRKPSVKVGG